MSYYAFIEGASFACKPPLKEGSEFKFPKEIEKGLRKILEEDFDFFEVDFEQQPEKGWICNLRSAGDSEVGDSFDGKLQETVAYLGENFATEAFLVVHINDDQTFHENRDTEYVGGPTPQAIEAFLRAKALERSSDLLLGAGFSKDDIERVKAALAGQQASPAPSPRSPHPAVRALHEVMHGLTDLGFGTDEREINGADAVEAIGSLVKRVMVSPGTGVTAYVVKSPKENAFLTHDDDWGDAEQARVFLSMGRPCIREFEHLQVDNLQFVEPFSFEPISWPEEQEKDELYDEDAMANFMLQRIEDRDMLLEEIPLRLARYGLMDPDKFVSEMRERMDNMNADSESGDGDKSGSPKV